MWAFEGIRLAAFETEKGENAGLVFRAPRISRHVERGGKQGFRVELNGSEFGGGGIHFEFNKYAVAA